MVGGAVMLMLCMGETVVGATVVGGCTPYRKPVECEHPGQCYNAAECTCGVFPVPKCATDPCDENVCLTGYKCIVNSCGGCNHQCVPDLMPVTPLCTPYRRTLECEHPGHCYNAATCTCGVFPVPKCTTDPCDENVCRTGYKCIVNSCGGCNHQCVDVSLSAPLSA